MTSRADLLQSALRTDFLTFLARSFREAHGGERLDASWPLEAVAHRLDRVRVDGGARLIINMPPRSLKSFTVSVAWVAWMLGRDPGLKFICASYAAELADKLSRDCRTLMQAPWYRELFPRTRLERSASHDLTTTSGGGRLATSVGGVLTGLGGDVIIIDDPLKPGEAASQTARAAVKEWYASTVHSRLDDKRRGSIVVVMQRVHEDDLSGHLLEAGGWDHLRLRAVADEEEAVSLQAGRVHHRRPGELLYPDRDTQADLDQQREVMGTPLFSAQYQQEPLPAAGTVVRREWLRRFDVEPQRAPGDRVVQSWDCASKEGAHNDFSVCITALVRGAKIHIVDVHRERVDFPKLCADAVRLARAHRCDTLLIEDAAAGQQLIQQLRSDAQRGVPRPRACTAQGDKVSRLAGSSAAIERGDLLLPHEALWLGAFERELLGFPGARHDDQVDALSQLLTYERDRPRTEDVSVGPIEITVGSEANRRAIARAAGVPRDALVEEDEELEGFWSRPTKHYD